MEKKIVGQWETFLHGTGLRVVRLHLIAALVPEGNRGHKEPLHFALLRSDKTVIPLPPPVPGQPLLLLGSFRASLRLGQVPFPPR